MTLWYADNQEGENPVVEFVQKDQGDVCNEKGKIAVFWVVACVIASLVLGHGDIAVVVIPGNKEPW